MPPRQPIDFPVVKKKPCSGSSRSQDFMKPGEVLTDVSNNQWKLGKLIGIGAFGDIFLASDDVSKPVSNDARYVVKVEPHSNGPLFVEMNFYLRVGKAESINEWKTKRKIKSLGMPEMIGFGSHKVNGEKFRFLVLPRYGESIQKLFVKRSKFFHIKTALTLACHILDVLEYVHSKGYIHSDIKGLNMVLGSGHPQPSVYLVDYGLTSRYTRSDGEHKPYTPDGRKAEAGTLEFSSRDAHIGAVSRRSDLESLGYNLVCWLGGRLPWESTLSHPEAVARLKESSMCDIKAFLSKAFQPKRTSPSVLEVFLNYVNQLESEAVPDYAYCKKIFRLAIRDAGFLDDCKLTFDTHAKLTKKALKRSAEIENLAPPQIKKRKKDGASIKRKPCSVFNDNTLPPSGRITRNLVDGSPKLWFDEFNWALVLASDPEKNCKKSKSPESTVVAREEAPVVKKLQESDISNPTPEMRKILRKRKQRSCEPVRRLRTDSCSYWEGETMTPAMEEVAFKKKPMTRGCRRTMKRPPPVRSRH